MRGTSTACLANSSRTTAMSPHPPTSSVSVLATVRSHLLRTRKRLLAMQPRFLLLLFLLNLTIIFIILTRSPFFSHPSRASSNYNFFTPRQPPLSLFRQLSGFDRSPPYSSLPSSSSSLSSPWFSSRSSTDTLRRYTLTPLQLDVRNVTQALFHTYFYHCRGHDEIVPTTNACLDWFHIGLTTLDTLDTLLLMDLREEYDASRKWAERELNLSAIVGRVSTFELVIRALGGMLSAYEMTGHSVWLRKRVELGELFLPFFAATHSGCPPMNVDFHKDVRPDGRPFLITDSISTPADAGTLQLEMRTLSALTGDQRFAAAGDRCIATMLRRAPSGQLVPARFDVQTGRFVGAHFTIGGAVDSFYEMLAKTWIAFGRADNDEQLRTKFTSTVDAIYEKLHGIADDGLHFIGERTGRAGRLRPQMDHLACFFPGTLAIGALHGLGGGIDGSDPEDYVPRARELVRTCYAMTRASEVGLAAEVTAFDEKHPAPKEGEDVSKLRPEIVEALFYMTRIDKSKHARRYRRWGKKMWQDMRNAAQVDGKEDGIMSGIVGLRTTKRGDYTTKDGKKLDSFVLAETMKYFFLLFDERRGNNVPLPLDEWVFNTEAHPVRVRKLEHGHHGRWKRGNEHWRNYLQADDPEDSNDDP